MRGLKPCDRMLYQSTFTESKSFSAPKNKKIVQKNPYRFIYLQTAMMIALQIAIKMFSDPLEQITT